MAIEEIPVNYRDLNYTATIQVLHQDDGDTAILRITARNGDSMAAIALDLDAMRRLGVEIFGVCDEAPPRDTAAVPVQSRRFQSGDLVRVIDREPGLYRGRTWQIWDTRVVDRLDEDTQRLHCAQGRYMGVELINVSSLILVEPCLGRWRESNAPMHIDVR